MKTIVHSRSGLWGAGIFFVIGLLIMASYYIPSTFFHSHFYLGIYMIYVLTGTFKVALVFQNIFRHLGGRSILMFFSLGLIVQTAYGFVLGALLGWLYQSVAKMLKKG